MESCKAEQRSRRKEQGKRAEENPKKEKTGAQKPVEDTGAGNVRKLANRYVFPMIGGSEGSK